MLLFSESQLEIIGILLISLHLTCLANYLNIVISKLTKAVFDLDIPGRHLYSTQGTFEVQKWSTKWFLLSAFKVERCWPLLFGPPFKSSIILNCVSLPWHLILRHSEWRWIRNIPLLLLPTIYYLAKLTILVKFWVVVMHQICS